MVLLVSTYVSGIGLRSRLAPYGGQRDRSLGRRSRTVGNVTGASVDAANDRERKMIVDPACRKVFSAIEQALASRLILTGADVAALLS